MEKPFCESSSDSEISSSEASGEHEATETQLLHDTKKVMVGLGMLLLVMLALVILVLVMLVVAVGDVCVGCSDVGGDVVGDIGGDIGVGGDFGGCWR